MIINKQFFHILKWFLLCFSIISCFIGEVSLVADKALGSRIWKLIRWFRKKIWDMYRVILDQSYLLRSRIDALHLQLIRNKQSFIDFSPQIHFVSKFFKGGYMEGILLFRTI